MNYELYSGEFGFYFKADIRLNKIEDAALKHELEPGLFSKVFMVFGIKSLNEKPTICICFLIQ